MFVTWKRPHGKESTKVQITQKIGNKTNNFKLIRYIEYSNIELSESLVFSDGLGIRSLGDYILNIKMGRAFRQNGRR